MEPTKVQGSGGQGDTMAQIKEINAQAMKDQLEMAKEDAKSKLNEALSKRVTKSADGIKSLAG